MNRYQFTALLEDEAIRVDVFLCGRLETLTRSAVQKLLEQKAVWVNGKAVSKNYRLRAGDEIVLQMPEVRPLELRPEPVELDIVYEDDDLLVVNKPKGMVVHPAPGNPDHTLVNALLAHCGESLSGINGVARPGILHRIDKDTSGLLLVAKNDFAHLALAEQIKEHSFTREYLTVVYGGFREESGTVDAPIGRSRTDRKKMCVTEHNSKRAVTHFTVLERYQGFTLLRCRLETGRTHQIRVHMAHIGHPVAGDPVYGPKKVIVSLAGQCLHAQKIGFVHPRTGQYLEFVTEMPDYMRAFIGVLLKI